MGTILLYHDLFSLISQQRSVLEKTAYTISRLIPTASIELASLSKDSRSLVDSQLQDRLFNLQTELKITGNLSLIEISNGAKILASTKASLRKGDVAIHLPNLDLAKDNGYSSDLKRRDGRFVLDVFAPIRNTSGEILAILAVESDESAFILRLIGYGLHYLLLGLGLVTIGGFGFLWISNKTSRSLRHLKDRYFTLFRESSDGILVIDCNGIIQKINRSALESFQAKETELVGKNFLHSQDSTVHFIPLEHSKDIRRQTLSAGLHFHSKAKIILSADKVRYLRYSSYPLQDRGGIDGALIIFQDITSEVMREQELIRDANELRSKNIELQQQVVTDPLTRLLNKQYLHYLLDVKSLRWLAIEGCSMLMIDLDNFKLLNDSLGHQKGDEILKSFAVFLRGFFRRSDKLIRFGGDEFVVVLPQTDIESASRIASNMNEKLRKTSDLFSLTVSIGVAELRIDETGDAWLDRADRALYKAKHSGKNSVRVNEESRLEVIG